MTYQQCLAMLKVFRPQFSPDLLTEGQFRETEAECIRLLSPANRYLPELLAKGLDLGEPPEQFDQVLYSLISLSDHDYYISLIKLGMCFCYGQAKDILDNPHITDQLMQTDPTLIDFFGSAALQYGEFYEPKASEILSSIIFDEDEFEPDMASVGLSLVLGYLDRHKFDNQQGVTDRKGPALHVIKQVREVPVQLKQDPTSSILNKIVTLE